MGALADVANEADVSYMRAYRAARRIGVGGLGRGPGRRASLDPGERDAVRLLLALDGDARDARLPTNDARRALIAHATTAARYAGPDRRWILATPEHGSAHPSAAAALDAWRGIGQPIAHVACLDRLSVAPELLSVASG